MFGRYYLKLGENKFLLQDFEIQAIERTEGLPSNYNLFKWVFSSNEALNLVQAEFNIFYLAYYNVVSVNISSEDESIVPLKLTDKLLFPKQYTEKELRKLIDELEKELNNIKRRLKILITALKKTGKNPLESNFLVQLSKDIENAEKEYYKARDLI